MSEAKPTLYLWDLADTLFSEVWNKKKSGYESYDTWLENHLGKPVEKMSVREYEWGYKIPFDKEFFELGVMPHVPETLKLTKYNEALTSGNHEQMDWRAAKINTKVSYDIRDLVNKWNSSFDYPGTHLKDENTYYLYLKEKYIEGFRTVVYTDDKPKYCIAFQSAAEKIKKEYGDFSYRLYIIGSKRKKQ